MGSGQAAAVRHAGGAIPPDAVADHDLNDSSLGIHRADAVALGVGEVDPARRGNGDAFGPGQLSLAGGAAVAGETALARPGDVVEDALLQVRSVEGIGVAQGDPELAAAIEGYAAGPAQRRLRRKGGPILGGRLPSVPADRVDEPPAGIPRCECADCLGRKSRADHRARTGG